VSREPREIGRHGRLSADYARASLDVAAEPARPVPAASQSVDAERAPPVPAPSLGAEPDRPQPGASARLGGDYQRAVAELVSNPSSFFRVILDDTFDGTGPGWPTDPVVEARRVDGGYRLMPLIDNQFLAIGAPVGSSLRDVQVGATFRKLGGPAGGTYGLLLRDRGPGPRDGRNQAGRYYVAQVDDRGLVSIWRRDQDTWFELVAWAPSTAVRPGEGSNDLSFEIVGGRLTFIINGQPAASANDAVLDHGGVGLFVGGRGNGVLVQRFVVHALG
jgi:hypothetical protein